jgi:hypothetical protein
MGPERGVHIQHVEQMWGPGIWNNKEHHSTARHNHIYANLSGDALKKVKIHLTLVTSYKVMLLHHLDLLQNMKIEINKCKNGTHTGNPSTC